MNKIYYNEALKERAKELRREATPQENKLWYRFLKKHLKERDSCIRCANE